MSNNTQQLLKRARELTEAKRHEDARLCLLELLKAEPNNETALIILGGAYFELGKYAEAEMVFERLILMKPGRGEYSIALFNTLWHQKRYEEALEEIKRFMDHADKASEEETIRQYIAIIKEFEG